MTTSPAPALAVGVPFVFEGVRCTVVELDDVRGKLRPRDPEDRRTIGFARADVQYDAAFEVFLLPGRLLKPEPRPATSGTVATPAAAGEG